MYEATIETRIAACGQRDGDDDKGGDVQRIAVLHQRGDDDSGGDVQ